MRIDARMLRGSAQRFGSRVDLEDPGLGIVLSLSSSLYVTLHDDGKSRAFGRSQTAWRHAESRLAMIVTRKWIDDPL